MAKARKATESENEQPAEQDQRSQQEQREAAREAAGQGNQDQENAPQQEGMPQPDTQRFITQPDVLNQPEGERQESDSYDESGEGRSGE